MERSHRPKTMGVEATIEVAEVVVSSVVGEEVDTQEEIMTTVVKVKRMKMEKAMSRHTIKEEVEAMVVAAMKEEVEEEVDMSKGMAEIQLGIGTS